MVLYIEHILLLGQLQELQKKIENLTMSFRFVYEQFRKLVNKFCCLDRRDKQQYGIIENIC